MIQVYHITPKEGKNDRKLEEIKQLGNYAVSVWFGEGVGCDDIDVPTNERKIVVMFSPIGFVGGKRNLWRGAYKDFIAFDLKQTPVRISNPPKKEEYENGGYFTWEAD